MDVNEHTSLIKQKALDLGFDFCGFAKAEKLSRDEAFLKKWLDKGLHAAMEYMENHFDKRIDPTLLVPGAKSVISVLLNYFPETQLNENVPQVAKYAYGEDYHFVIREKLNQLLTFINKEITPCNGRGFTDSAPVLDRAWAAKAGLGWIGKNTNLIVPQKGSFFFIGELIIDLELVYNSPIKDMCGSCTKCIQACPTNALIVPYLLDSNRCISFQTIENKTDIPQKLKGKFKNWIFGCDICQDVCPWNKFSEPTEEESFTPSKSLLELSTDDWHSMDEETFKKIFRKSPLKRTKYSGIKRNLEFIKDEK